ncbi:MAG: glycosyltransferase [Cryomorphaceae bacterium]|nr:glycosyltransferase [Cryomorphaceae bacterium]
MISDKKIRVANVVLNNFTTDNRVYKISKSLQDANYEVVVVALLKGDVPASEVKDGIEVNRIALKSINLPEGTFWGLIKFMEIIFRIVKNYRKYDVWHCNDIEAFGIGVVARFFRPKLKLVYDCHEFEGERNGRSSFERRLVRWFEKLFIHRAKAVITVSPNIAKAYTERYGVDPVWLVRNVPHKLVSPDKKNIFRMRFNIPNDEPVFLYQGAFTYNRGLEEALQAFKEISGAHLVCMGYGIFQNLVEESARDFENIHFMPAVPYHEVLDHTASADVGLLSVRPTCLSYLFCLPNKLFEYIQAGIPILSNDLPDCRKIIEDYNIGWVLNEFTAESLKMAVNDLKGKDFHVFNGGLTKAQNDLHWEKEEQVLFDLYKDVIWQK